MQKYFRLSRLSNVIPEVIALLIIFGKAQLGGLFDVCSLLLIYSTILRLVWNGAIIVHGLGHTITIAIVDRDLSVLNLTNILEHRKITAIFKSLLPYHSIFIPTPSPHSLSPYLKPGNLEHTKIKALGGILGNLAIAIIFCFASHNIVGRVAIVANLLITFSSLSDIEAFITGAADYLYCGNFGAIALRKPEDGQKLLPARILDIALQMGHETEIRGEQAGGGFVIGRQSNKPTLKDISKCIPSETPSNKGLAPVYGFAKSEDLPSPTPLQPTMLADSQVVFVGKKIVNRKRSNLTKSLEAAFAPVRNRAIAAGVKPLESTVMGVWHYRYATSGTAPSKLETHWHEWMGAREREVWQFTDEQWIVTVKNVNHRITHNGDFNSWTIFNRQIDNTTLGLWLERVLHTPNGTTGDSPKIAGMMDLLITQGMWYPSVRLAYQQAIATTIEDAFDGQHPTAKAPNTAPSDSDLNAWAEIFEGSFTAELSQLKHPDSLKSSASLQQRLLQAFKNHPSTENWSQLQTISFIQHTLKVFFANDLYRATQIFIEQAQGSFGLVTASTLEESNLVLCAKKQPISIGFNKSQGYTIYASEPAAVDRILLNKPRSFRLDLDQRSGEVAKVSAKDITVYSLSQQEELQDLQLKDRWISMTKYSHLSTIKLDSVAELDPVAHDINSIPRILHKIKTDWENPISLNRRSADYLVYLLTEKVQRFEKKQRLMFKAGLISKVREMSAVDLLITGEENSLWLGEKFAQDLKVVFPFLNIVTSSANQILQQLDCGFGQLNLGKDSLVLAITQSGQTFSTVQVINVFDRLSSQGIIGELFIMTGELSSFINFTQGQGGLTTISHSAFLDSEDSDRRYRVFVNRSGRRTAEPSTVAVAAAGQTLTELLFYLAKQMRNDFPNSDPFGMTLTTESIMVLAMMKDDFLNKNVLKIIGTNIKGESIKSVTKQTLIQNGCYWANHITETPLVWAIHSLYIFISVSWVVPFGHTLPLVKTISQLLFNLTNLPTNLIQLLTPIVTFADAAVYIFGAWLWTLAIRYFQGRQLLARTGKRTLVIGDVSWVNQLLQAYVSKLFSLSYGIATIEVHSANPQNHLLHAFGHRVVRGTLVWLGVPDGRRGKQQQEAENAAIVTAKQINGVKNFNVGAEIMTLTQNPEIARQGFTKALVLDSNNDSIYFRSTTPEQKEQLEKLRESCFGSFERLLASYVFFWALAKKVASLPLLKYEYWKSQSRTKVMTTASPATGFDLDRANKKNNLVEVTRQNT